MKLMKLLLDERVKHRLTGVLVIISIAVIFVPAMIKKSNQHLGERINVSVKLPPKPVLPKVAVVKEKAVFNSVKVAHVDMPTISAPPKSTQLVKAVEEIKPVAKVPAVQVALQEPVKPIAASVDQNKIKESNYVVQLAAFSQEQNAASLVTRLKNKGFTASYNKQGDIYKVYVGGSIARRDEARVLQKKLADSLQLNGLIIKEEVS